MVQLFDLKNCEVKHCSDCASKTDVNEWSKKWNCLRIGTSLYANFNTYTGLFSLDVIKMDEEEDVAEVVLVTDANVNKQKQQVNDFASQKAVGVNPEKRKEQAKEVPVPSPVIHEIHEPSDGETSVETKNDAVDPALATQNTVTNQNGGGANSSGNSSVTTTNTSNSRTTSIQKTGSPEDTFKVVVNAWSKFLNI